MYVKPAWIIQQVLDPSKFACCGNEDLQPFRCAGCTHPMIVCLECDSLYQKLPNTSATHFLDGTEASCPLCSTSLAVDSFTDPAGRISFDEWARFGLDGLLRSRSIEDLSNMVVRSSNTLADYLQRNQQSTAKIRARDVARIADAIVHCHEGAEDARLVACNEVSAVSRAVALANAMANSSPILRAYAILGVSDSLHRN